MWNFRVTSWPGCCSIKEVWRGGGVVAEFGGKSSGEKVVLVFKMINWLAQGDIFLHVGVSAIMAIMLIAFFVKGARLSRASAITLTIMLVMTVGIGKEFYDGTCGADIEDAFSVKDIVSDYAGLILGVLSVT